MVILGLLYESTTSTKASKGNRKKVSKERPWPWNMNPADGTVTGRRKEEKGS